MTAKWYELTKLNVTPSFVKRECVSRAPNKAQSVSLQSESKSLSNGDDNKCAARSKARQAKRVREQGGAAAAKRSADTGRTVGLILVTGLSSVDFILPYPPSANRYWRTTRNGKTYVSEAAKAYKASVRRLIGNLPVTDTEVSVQVHIYRPARRGDLDNCIKILLDALKGLVFGDDAQVAHLQFWRHDDKSNPRAEVRIGAPPEPSPDAFPAGFWGNQ